MENTPNREILKSNRPCCTSTLLITVITILLTIFVTGCSAVPPEAGSTTMPAGSTGTTETIDEPTLPSQSQTEHTPENTEADISTLPESSVDPQPEDTTELEHVENTKPHVSGTKPEPTPTKPTQNTEPPVSDNTIAGGQWDGGPVTWKVTKDGVLTISGNRSVQDAVEGNYSWNQYSDVITSVVIEDGITDIPQYAFFNMKKIKSVYIGNAVDKIDEYAFYNCTGIQSITFPASLKTIDSYAFASCSNLQTLHFASGGKLETIKEAAFTKSGITQLVTPASLRTIETKAFSDCLALQSVRLSDGITLIKAKAFQNCANIKTLYLASSISSYENYVFDGCNAIESIENHSSAIRSFDGQTKLTTLVIGGNRTESNSYDGCSALSKVTITSPITKISNYAFNKCHTLSSFKIPNTVTTIGLHAFTGTAITKITIPASVKEIGMFAFTNSALQEVVFEGSPPKIENSSAFTGLTITAYYPADNPAWNADTLQNYGGTITWIPA